MKIYFLLFSLIFLSFLFETRAQTIPCDIKYKDGKGINKTRMIGIHEDLLLVSDTGNYKIINVDKIARVRFDNGTYLWEGVGIGAGVGFVAGVVLYELVSSKKKNFIIKDPSLGITLVFALPGAIIGGIVGLIFHNIDDYDLSQMHPYVKAKELKFIMNDHSEWK